MVDYGHVSEAQMIYNQRAAEYLIERGWRNTSDNPAFLVLWTRVYSVTTIMVDQVNALAIQRAIDFNQDEKANP